MNATLQGQWTPVLVTGDDARKFLQGQLTNDLRKLTPEQAILASCTSAQGRVMSIPTLIERPEGIFALMPAATLEPTLSRMRRMLLRSKLAFEEQPRGWALTAVAGGASAALPQRPGACIVSADASLMRWWSHDERYILLAKHSGSQPANAEASGFDAHWHLADVCAGLPAIYPATQASFVPQMLNLDLLHAVSYDKGCYVGQEVVARARRAQVKRRMFRFSASCMPPAPGTRVVHEQSEVGEVVDAAAVSGGCELLAVVERERCGAELRLQDGVGLTWQALPYQSAIPK